MATHKVAVANWHMDLARIIEESEDGDTVLVHDDEQRELGKRAHGRMCPDKKLTFTVEP